MNMTTLNMTDSALAIVAECGGSSTTEADLMIGIGLVKDSEAVYFQYLGDEQSTALVKPNGKPVDRIGNVRLTGLSIAEMFLLTLVSLAANSTSCWRLSKDVLSCLPVALPLSGLSALSLASWGCMQQAHLST